MLLNVTFIFSNSRVLQFSTGLRNNLRSYEKRHLDNTIIMLESDILSLLLACC